MSPINSKLIDITETIGDGRKRLGGSYLVGYIHAYCDSGQCVAREFRVRVKGYEDEDPKPFAVNCPLCGKTAIADVFKRTVETLHEARERIDRQSRINVNIQRYKKQRDTLIIPVSLLADDSLPG